MAVVAFILFKIAFGHHLPSRSPVVAREIEIERKEGGKQREREI